MAQGKVEICGVNTAKLPILNERRRKLCLCVLKREIRKRKKNISKVI